MLSRVAGSLYWMSRYLERAEHTARLIDVQLNQMLDQAGGDTSLRWQRLLHSLRMPSPEGAVDAYSVTQALTFDVSRTSSIAYIVCHFSSCYPEYPYPIPGAIGASLYLQLSTNLAAPSSNLSRIFRIRLAYGHVRVFGWINWILDGRGRRLRWNSQAVGNNLADLVHEDQMRTSIRANTGFSA